MPTSHSTRCRPRQHRQLPRLSLHSQSVHSEANDSLRLAHSLPPQLKLCTLLSATTEFTNCGMPKPKVHRMWYDCFRLKPNVRQKWPSVHIRRQNRSRNSVDLYWKVRDDIFNSSGIIVLTERQTDKQTLRKKRPPSLRGWYEMIQLLGATINSNSSKLTYYRQVRCYLHLKWFLTQ